MKNDILFEGSFNSREEVKNYVEEVISVEDKIIDELLKILKQSSDYWIKNEIALLLDRYKSDKILEALVEEIRKPESYNKNGVLVDACTKYDCTKYFNFFIELILKEPGESFLWSMDVVHAMEGPFNSEDLKLAIENIDSAISANTTPEKKSYLEKVSKYLKELSIK